MEASVVLFLKKSCTDFGQSHRKIDMRPTFQAAPSLRPVPSVTASHLPGFWTGGYSEGLNSDCPTHMVETYLKIPYAQYQL